MNDDEFFVGLQELCAQLRASRTPLVEPEEMELVVAEVAGLLFLAHTNPEHQPTRLQAVALRALLPQLRNEASTGENHGR